jgi:hypothetical protein
MKNLLLFLLFIPLLLLGQTAPPPPAPPPPTSSAQEDFGSTQNNIAGAQSRSFGGGSIIKPNQILNSADFALIGSPTYETFKFRPGTSLSWSSINFGKGFGINAVLTFDLSQQAYSFYYRHEKWYYHVNFGRMGVALNTGASATRVWEPKNIKDFTLGAQLGVGIVANGKSTDKDAYFVAVPYLVLLTQKEFKLSERIDIRPEAYLTMCSPYYDIGMNFFSTSSTFNAVVGNCVEIKVSKKFKVNLTYRGNMNTTPKWGLMHNILIGSTLKF